MSDDMQMLRDLGEVKAELRQTNELLRQIIGGRAK